jgi:anhydro-N-acetylmuramic acid kinase
LRGIVEHIRSLREKESRKIIGLMSGTSVDGITAALTEISGTGINVKVRLIGFKTYTFNTLVKKRIFDLFNSDSSTVQDVCEMNYVLGEVFGEVVNRFVDELGNDRGDVDIVGSHGQTIWHQPVADSVSCYSAKSTLQIGEPAVISEKTGYPVVSDFRKADMAVGGQGAPLTPYLDYVLHRDPFESRVFQNIGGIANLTFIPSDASISDVVAFDSGTGNMVIDWLVKNYTGSSHDVDGSIASKGEVNNNFLSELMKHSYFKLKPPKTTGRETFGEHYSKQISLKAEELNIDVEDLIATATMLTVETIVDAYNFLPKKVEAVYVSGGGAKNLFLIKSLEKRLRVPVYDYSVLGFPSEAKEAVLVSLLTNEYVMETPSNVLAATGARRKVVLGYCTWI